MKRVGILFLAGVISLLASVNASAQNRSNGTEGFYKDIFMDSGINVTSTKDLPASRFLGLSIEAFISAPHSPMELTIMDTIVQQEMLCGSPWDENGTLLYPDGEPRFRMIYMNGGRATKHGNSLTPKGRDNMRQFIANGGSYVGTCAGMFIASNGVYSEKEEYKPNDKYLSIWEGTTHSSGLSKSYTAMKVVENSPLLNYFDFGADMRIDSVRHNGGGYAYYGEGGFIPEGTVPLLKYIYDTVGKDVKARQIHDQISTWGYKKNDTTGRVVVTGSHPEAIAVGERLEFMAAMILYALDGNGVPKVKGALTPGQFREMDKKTSDQKPEFTRIGDKQYHHFTVEIPQNARRAVVSLEGYPKEDNFDLTLCAKENDFAFHSTTDIKNVAKGCNKTLIVNSPSEGTLYISVRCETTVDAHTGNYGTEYSGRTDVLNGVPYKIKVEIE